MIFCAWVVWNEAQLIRKSIESVKDYVDYFIVVDGAFQSNLKAVKENKILSTDNTIEIVKSLIPQNKLSIINPPNRFWVNEAEKRTAYCKEFFKLGKAGDWLLWLDGDEILTDNVKGGFDYLRKINKDSKAYKAHWVWVKSTYPSESPIHYEGDEWKGYKEKYDIENTYFDMGRRINILPYEDIHYVNALQPANNKNQHIRPLDNHVNKFFMIWNLVWLRNAEMLGLRYERCLIERKPNKGKWRDESWATKILDDMEKRYNVKLDI